MYQNFILQLPESSDRALDRFAATERMRYAWLISINVNKFHNK